jgi:hypothetical protein
MGDKRIHQVMFGTDRAAETAVNALRREGLPAVRIAGTMVCVPEEGSAFGATALKISEVLRDYLGRERFG